MGCAASKAPQKRDPVEELIEEAHAQQGRESGGGVTLDLSAAPASSRRRDFRGNQPCRDANPRIDLPEFTTLNAGGNPREAAWKS